MDVKSAFFYGIIDEEVYVSQPPGFVDAKFPKKAYKVVKALYGLHQAPRALYATLFTFLLKSGYRRGTIDNTLFIKKDRNDILLVQVQQKEDGIFISQDKYVAEILKKFDFDSVKTANTPIETQKPLTKDEKAADVDVHLYRSMISSLMYLTAFRPDIMYLKGKPKLGLWYPRVSSFDLEAYSDSDYAGANFDRKSTTRGCQFLGRRLISWQCKKQAEYVAAVNCRGQVLWIQNQMLDYGFNFMNTKIYIDNKSIICIVKNPVFHSKTKHIEIRHHFMRDAYEKKLIQVLKIHTDDNVADLLTKAFDVSRPKLSTARPKLSTDSNKIERMKLEAMVEERRIFKSLAIPWQTTTGKESSNPLMADSLPKTIQSNDLPLSRGYTLGSGEDSLKQMELMEFVQTCVTITSSPSLSPQHTPVSTPSTSPPPIPETTPTAEEPALMPYESPLQSVHSLGRDKGSVSLNELIDLVAQRSSSQQGAESLIDELDMDADFSLVPPHDAEIQEKISDDTKVLLEEEETTELIEEPTELVEDQGSGEKGEQEVTTTDTALNTAMYKVSMALQIDLRSELIHYDIYKKKGQYIFMLVEKDYPLTKGLATLMLSNKLRVDQQSEMADELLTKIYNLANKSRK
ncbi:putative ribonuclease H-like domain-containing protein [Tanacetum coccineum]